MKSKERHKGIPALELIEEAIHLLRKSPLHVPASYYIGSLPFILGLLFFWADMSHNAFAAEHCITASLGMGFLFIWMKCWQTVFMSHIQDHLSGQKTSHWSWRRVLKIIIVQVCIQTSGLFVLTLAGMIMVPFGWCYAFYQNASFEGNGQDLQIGKTIQDSWSLAKLWSGQNHLILLIISLFSLFVFLNARIGIILIPEMLKMFFDIESVFTLSEKFLFNATLFLTAGGITYLCVDPLIKTIYALRCFYGKAVFSGDDLKSDLRRFRLQKTTSIALVVILALTLFCVPGRVFAKTNTAKQKKQTQEKFINPRDLDRSIQEIMDQRQFTWRMPREKPADDQPKSFLAKMVDSMNAFLKKSIRGIYRAIERFFKALGKLFPDVKPLDKPHDFSWVGSIRTILYLIAALLLIIGSVLGYKLWRQHTKENKESTPEKPLAQPDLDRDDINPADFASQYWLNLADNLLKQGSLRLAIRAIYLGMVAQLAEKGLIVAARYKSNRDYLHELKRREHALQGVIVIFSDTVATFDRIWYGMKSVYLEDIQAFRENLERIIAFAPE